MRLINERTEVIATKLGENKLNDIVVDENSYYRIYLNDGYYALFKGNEEMMSMIKNYTWIKEKNNNSVKTNSDILNTIYLQDFLDNYKLPRYEILEGTIEQIRDELR